MSNASGFRRLYGFLAPIMFAVGAVLCCADTAAAQNALLVSDTSLTFTVQSGASSSRVLVAGSSGAALTVSAAATGGAWLSVSPASGTTPASFTVTVNSGSMAAGTYNGAIVLTAAGASNSPVTVPVTMAVNATSQVTVNPGSLAFNFQTGGTPPVSQTVAVTSSGAPVSFTASASVAAGTGANWLSVVPGSATTPGTLTVSANPTGLTPGTYNGTISLTVSGNATPTLIPVTLTVSAVPTLTVSPANLTLNYQIGGSANPGQQTVSVTSSGNSLNFTVTKTSAASNWLVVSPVSGVTPANLSVGVDAAAIPAPGTYSGSIVITAPGASNGTQTVNVTLIVSTAPQVLISPQSLSFNYQIGGAVPANASVDVKSTGGALNFIATAAATTGNWLQVASPASGSTPGTVSIGVSPTSLNPGTYNGQVTITGTGAGNPPQTVNVTLTVSNNPLLTFFPPSFQFNFQTGGQAPAAQTLTLNSTGAPLGFTVTTTGSWLSVTSVSGNTPATLAVSVNPSLLAAGTYNGSITVTGNGPGNTPQTIPVTLVVSGTAVVNASPGALSFNSSAGGTIPPAQTIALTSTGDPVNFTITNNNTSLLFVSPVSGTTPGNLTVAVIPPAAMGTYSGSITVTGGGVSQTIPIRLTVDTGISISVSPGALSFSQAAGGSAPATQTLAVTSSGAAVPVSAAANVSWLTVTPASGNTPATFTVKADGSALAQGVYTGFITLISAGATNSPQNIQVTLSVGPPTALVSNQSSLAFNGQVGAAAPGNQTLNITATGGATVNFTAAASSSTAACGNFLTVSPSSGTTPGNLTIGVNPASISAAGTCNGAITITPSGGGTPLVVNIALNIAAQAPVVFSAIVNAASQTAGPVAPGEIITIYGTGLGPAGQTSFRLNSAGGVDSILANTRVLFDGTPATMLFVSSTQVNAIVPYEVEGRAVTQVSVEFLGTRSAATSQTVAQAAPGIFTLDSSGRGQGAVLNQNNSVNGASNPAAKGSVIVIFATGEGQTNPLSITGSVSGSVLKLPRGAVTVTIGGAAAQVMYAGSAPGLVAGVLQVNARVPDTAITGAAVPVAITVGGVSSQFTATVAVQ